MTLVPLSPPPGIDSDNSTFSAQGRWADGNNVRPYNGSMQTLGAYSSAITLGGIIEIAVVSGTSGGIYTVLGAGDKLWSGAGFTGPTDVSPIGCPTGIASWSFAPYGGTVMCNPYNGTIYQYTVGSGVAATVIGAAPDQIRTILVARRQVLAFGCNEEISTNFNGHCIRGSDIEDPTDWTTTSTNNAFEYILDDAGTIVAAANVGDYIAVLTATSLWMGTYVGDPSQVYRFDRIDGGVGIVASPNAVCEAGGVLYWLGMDLQIWSWTPGALPTPVPCPISKDFRDNLDSTDGARMVAIPHFNEIWLFYADARDGTGKPSRYIAFNRQGQWFRGQLARDAVCANGLVSAQVQSSDPAAAGGFIAAAGSFIYAHELSSGTALDWSLTTADQYIDNSGRRMNLDEIRPDFTDQSGTITLSINTREYPQSTGITTNTYSLTAGAEYVSVYEAGKIVSAGFSGSGFARFGKPTFAATPAGQV